MKDKIQIGMGIKNKEMNIIIWHPCISKRDYFYKETPLGTSQIIVTKIKRFYLKRLEVCP